MIFFLLPVAAHVAAAAIQLLARCCGDTPALLAPDYLTVLQRWLVVMLVVAATRAFPRRLTS